MKVKTLLACVCVAAVSAALFLVHRSARPTSENFFAQSSIAPVPAMTANEELPATAASAPTTSVASPAAAPRSFTAALPEEVHVTPDPEREPSFAAFEQWFTRYQQADEATKKNLEAEG